MSPQINYNIRDSYIKQKHNHSTLLIRKKLTHTIWQLISVPYMGKSTQ